MSNFHKPKVYRSPKGCCICRAKSSSSRFTDSGKYECDFAGCFRLEEHRSGEICNACVLLVKRWKKLPPDSDRHWDHVVDLRAGPGIKSLTRFKAKNKKKPIKQKEFIEKFEKIVKKNRRRLNGSSPAPNECNYRNVIMKLLMDDECTQSKRTKNAEINETKGIVFYESNRVVVVSKVLEMVKAQQTEVVLTSNSCSSSGTPSLTSTPSSSPAHSVETTADTPVTEATVKLSPTDYSSDSGYDESSNQGTGKSKKDVINNKICNSNNISNSNQKIRQVEITELEITSALETVRLDAESIETIAMEQESFICEQITINPLIDFAIHASARQAVMN